jgi:hypothetical protein
MSISDFVLSILFVPQRLPYSSSGNSHDKDTVRFIANYNLIGVMTIADDVASQLSQAMASYIEESLGDAGGHGVRICHVAAHEAVAGDARVEEKME